MMNPLAAGAVVLVIAAVMALPFLIMSRASRGGAQLVKIVRVVAVGTIVIAGGAALVAVLNLADGRTTVTVPVSVVPIHQPTEDRLLGPTATIAGGGFDQVTVVADGLSSLTRLTLASAVLLWSVMAIAVAAVVIRLARTLDGGDPFALSSTALVTTGWIVMVGGTAATWVGSLGDWLAASDLFAVNSWTSSGSDVDPARLSWPEPGQLRLDLPWMPLLAGLGLIVLAAVFRHGAQLRQDAAGLI